MAACRSEILRLYKSLLREGSKFSSYNFRMYTIRRVKDAFREHQHEKDPQQIQELVSHGRKNLEVIKRQVIVANLYKTDRLVIEQQMQ